MRKIKAFAAKCFLYIARAIFSIGPHMRKIKAFVAKCFLYITRVIFSISLIIVFAYAFVYLASTLAVFGFLIKGIQNGYIYACNEIIPNLHKDALYFLDDIRRDYAYVCNVSIPSIHRYIDFKTALTRDFWINSITNRDNSLTSSFLDIRQLVPMIKDSLIDLAKPSSYHQNSHIYLYQHGSKADVESISSSTLIKLKISIYSSIIILSFHYVLRSIKRLYFSNKYKNTFTRMATCKEGSVFNTIDPVDQIRAVLKGIKALEKDIDSLKDYKFKISINMHHIVTITILLLIFLAISVGTIINHEAPLCVFIYFMISALWAFEIYPSLSTIDKVDCDTFANKQKQLFFVSIFYYIFHITKHGIRRRNTDINSAVCDCKWLLLYTFPSSNQAIKCLKDKDDNIVYLRRISSRLQCLIDNNIVDRSHLDHIISHISDIISIINRWPASCSIYSTLNIPEINQVSIESQEETQEES